MRIGSFESLFVSPKLIVGQNKTLPTKVLNQFVIEPLPDAPPAFLVASASDVHLENHSGNHLSRENKTSNSNGKPFENPHRTHFRMWLTDGLINKEIEKTNDRKQVTLVLLGDIFDFNASWTMDSMPYGRKGKITDTNINQQIFKEIVSNNYSIVMELRRFLEASKYSRVVNVRGNHDNLLFLDPNLQKLLQETLLPGAGVEERNKRIIFTNSVTAPVLGYYAEHGQRFDSFNYSKNGSLTLGDWFTIKTSILFYRISEQLRKLDLEEKTKGKIIDRVKLMECVRPTPAVLMYLDTLADNYYEQYQDKDRVSAKNIRDIIMSYSEEIGAILEELPLLQKLNDIEIFPSRLLNWVIRRRQLQSFSARAIAWIEYLKTDSNTPQIEEAKKLVKSNTSLQYFAGGHTHKVEELDDRRNGFHYFNLGSWMPLIKGLKKGEPQSILPRSILKLETDLATKKRKPRINFEFNTIVEGTTKSKPS